jgi:hypothetical protein
MKTAAATSTEQIIVPTQSSAFSQEPIQDANTPLGLFVVGGLLIGGLGLVIATTIGGLVLAIAKRCCVCVSMVRSSKAQITLKNYTKRPRRRLVRQSLGRTHKVGTSNRHSRPHSNSYRDSSWSSDNSSSCTSYDSNPTSWSSDNSSSSWSSDSSPTSWSSDSSSSSWSSDSSSSCTSYDSSSSSSFDGGSSGGGGAGSDW